MFFKLKFVFFLYDKTNIKHIAFDIIKILITKFPANNEIGNNINDM